MSATDDAVAGFVGKWFEREPEMRIAAVFCPAPSRPVFEAWGALLHELRSAAFELSDARVTEAKCAWWAEELAGWSAGRSRHPLGRVLSRLPAPWAALGAEWARFPDADTRYSDTPGVLAALALPAQAVAAVEQSVFDGHRGGAVLFVDESTRLADLGRGIAVHWLACGLSSGLGAGYRARVPLHLVARHGQDALAQPGPVATALSRDWAIELKGLRAQPHGTLSSRLRRTFDGARLDRIAVGKGGPPPSFATLWQAWQTARATP